MAAYPRICHFWTMYLTRIALDGEIKDEKSVLTEPMSVLLCSSGTLSKTRTNDLISRGWAGGDLIVYLSSLCQGALGCRQTGVP